MSTACVVDDASLESATIPIEVVSCVTAREVVFVLSGTAEATAETADCAFVERATGGSGSGEASICSNQLKMLPIDEKAAPAAFAWLSPLPGQGASSYSVPPPRSGCWKTTVLGGGIGD